MLLVISGGCIYASRIFFKIASFTNTLSNPIDRKIFELKERVKIGKIIKANSKINAEFILYSLEANIKKYYGDIFSISAIIKFFLQSLIFCIFISLLVGVFLFEKYYGIIEIFQWKTLMAYLGWISITASLVGVFDVICARLVLNRINKNSNIHVKFLYLFIMLLLPLLLFMSATAIASGTAMNSIAFAKGGLGYWNFDFILQRFSLLLANPFANINNIKIISTGRFIQPQVITFLSSIGSLTILSIIILTFSGEKFLRTQMSFKFFQIKILNTMHPSKLMTNVLFGLSFCLFMIGMIFLYHGL